MASRSSGLFPCGEGQAVRSGCRDVCRSGSIPALTGRAAPPILKMGPFRAVFGALRRCLPECHSLTGGRLRFRRGHSQFGAVSEFRASVRSSGCRMRVPGRGLPSGSVGSAFSLRTGFSAVAAAFFRAVASASCRVRLSPRPSGIEGRSIPACAGEPPRRGSPTPAVAVYPRVCGGTRSVIWLDLWIHTNSDGTVSYPV